MTETRQKRLTRGQAIVAFCKECFGHDGYRGSNTGTPSKKAAMMVKQCSDTGCPLWRYRNGSENQ